jgi:hypothetical protein
MGLCNVSGGAAPIGCGMFRGWVLYDGLIFQVFTGRQVMHWIVIILAGLGAGMLLTALAFVTVLIGVLVNFMILLFSGPLIDARFPEKSQG